MKKIITKLLILAVAMLLVTSCNDDYPIMYDEANIIVGMNSTSVSVLENATGSIDVYLGAVTGTTATDVVLEVSTDGVATPAVEGTDYTLSSKNLNVPVGIASVTVTPIDNSIFEGNKQFIVTIVSNSKNYDLAVQQSVTVTIVDDEHPLKNWIGTYTVEAISYGSPGAWDEEWTVTTSPVASDASQLQLIGFGNPSPSTTPVIATLDTDAMTITIDSPSSLGAAYTYANVSVYYATDELLAIASGYVTTGLLNAAATQKITGTIEADGTIRIDRMCIILDDYVYAWDCFNTIWTK